VLVQATMNAPLIRVKLLRATNGNPDSFSYSCLCERSLKPCSQCKVDPRIIQLHICQLLPISHLADVFRCPPALIASINLSGHITSWSAKCSRRPLGYIFFHLFVCCSTQISHKGLQSMHTPSVAQVPLTSIYHAAYAVQQSLQKQSSGVWVLHFN